MQASLPRRQRRGGTEGGGDNFGRGDLQATGDSGAGVFGRGPARDGGAEGFGGRRPHDDGVEVPPGA